jgi:hypothetical protein
MSWFVFIFSILVESEQFIDGVMSHPSLKELSIKNNHLSKWKEQE